MVGLTADDLTPYNTVIIDTGGTLITKLMAFLISQDPKNAGSYGGMSGKGWGNVNSAIDVLLSKIIGAKKDVVIVCHMEEQEKNGNITERIDASGKPRNTIYRLSDAMCRIVMNPDGSRFLNSIRGKVATERTRHSLNAYHSCIPTRNRTRWLTSSPRSRQLSTARPRPRLRP